MIKRQKFIDSEKELDAFLCMKMDALGEQPTTEDLLPVLVEYRLRIYEKAIELRETRPTKKILGYVMLQTEDFPDIRIPPAIRKRVAYHLLHDNKPGGDHKPFFYNKHIRLFHSFLQSTVREIGDVFELEDITEFKDIVGNIPISKNKRDDLIRYRYSVLKKEGGRYKYEIFKILRKEFRKYFRTKNGKPAKLDDSTFRKIIKEK